MLYSSNHLVYATSGTWSQEKWIPNNDHERRALTTYINFCYYCAFQLLLFHIRNLKKNWCRERGREGEREGEKHRPVASCTCPEWIWNLQPRPVPWPEIKPAGWRAANWTTLAGQKKFLSENDFLYSLTRVILSGYSILFGQ